MKPQQLPHAAEVIRNEIKEMIDAQGKLLEEDVDENGNKRYKGTLLDEKISQLKVALEIDEVSTVTGSQRHFIDL
ncbi:hypothetical protein N7451_008897 [Penicillium sp. IBT 35674x]|nr:hypothetical protein N7451_008897 [Penicillium sp. IBT 35674x]